MHPSNSRRDFFSSGFRSLLNDAADYVGLKEPLAFLGFDKSYVRLSREAMATNFEVVFGAYEEMKFRRTATEILDEIDRLEAMLSIWKGETELMRVNRDAWKEPVRVSPEIFALVKLAKEVFSWTDGAYDITSTPLAKCWGFFYRQGRMPLQEEIDEARRKTGMQHVILDEEAHSVFFEKEGIEITPASIGKGFALDCAVPVARRQGLKDFMLNGGHSSIFASGAPAWKEVWQFNIRNPLCLTEPVAQVNIRNRGFSSSGREEQFFVHNGKEYGHIIDPRTGFPAERLLSVSVIAPNAGLAEALSTAFYVLGVEQTLKYCENHPDIGVVMITPPTQTGEPEIIIANLNEFQLEVINESWLVHRHIN